MAAGDFSRYFRTAGKPGPPPIAREGQGALISRARSALGGPSGKAESARMFAMRLGVDPRTITRWEANEIKIPKWPWGLIYFHLREIDADPDLINALPVRRQFYPRIRGSRRG